MTPGSISSFDRCYESLISAGSLGEVLPWISSWRRGYLKGALKDESGAYLVVNEGDGIPGRANAGSLLPTWHLCANDKKILLPQDI